MMNLRIEFLPEKKFVGKRMKMSFSDNKTSELWQNFMPRRREIANSIGNALYSIEVYPANFFDAFNPEREFEKWATVEVSDFEKVLGNLATITLPIGLYAVFNYKGSSAEGARTYQYIFAEWLPKSEYLLDERPHFAKMGEKYKNDDPNSEEEIFIPIRSKISAD